MKSVYLPSKDNDFSPSDLVSAIVHELRTPISAIISFSEFLKDDLRNPRSAEECADYVQEINLVATEMDELINDILDVKSASISNDFSINVSKDIDFCNIIKRSIKLNYDYSLKRRVSLKTQIDTGLKPIELDPKRIKQILTNLISNSIKYSPEGSEVMVSVASVVMEGKESLEIVVADQGFGMTGSQIETAFEKYKVVENPNSGNVDSFGMGLPIVKKLVELQNGSIEIESEVCVGTRVIVRFSY